MANLAKFRSMLSAAAETKKSHRIRQSVKKRADGSFLLTRS